MGKQVGVSLVMRATNTAAQLMQLGKAELIGAVDDDGVGVRVVDAGFDDGRTQQQIVFLLREFAHHPLQLALRQLTVADHDARFRQQLFKTLAHVFDGVHFVVQEVDLAAALKLAQTGLAHQTERPA